MIRSLIVSLCLFFSAAHAEPIDASTPAVQTIKAKMHARHSQLLPYYASGAVGLNLDGTIFLRDIASVPLAARKGLNALVDAENQDRDALYGEISNSAAHPEWKPDVQRVFAPRWIAHAERGWWVMSDHGWIQK